MSAATVSKEMLLEISIVQNNRESFHFLTQIPNRRSLFLPNGFFSHKENEIGEGTGHTSTIKRQQIVLNEHKEQDEMMFTKGHNSYAEYLMRNAELDEAQAGIKIAGSNINKLRYADDTTLMAECEEELKSLLMKVKEESKKVGLKLNIQKTKIMASGPITSWQIDGESYDQPRQHIKKQRHYFANKGLSSQGYGFSSGHVWIWELDYKESEVPKNWCFWIVVLEKTLESPLDCKEIQPVHPKRDQTWVFIGRIDFEAETPILWPPDTKNWLIGKDPDAGKDWGQEEKGTTENEMVGWHHRLDGHEFE